MRAGDRYTDREFCAAEKRAGVYGCREGGRVFALAPSGRIVLMPVDLAQAWEQSPLQEPSVDADPWSVEDELAAERAGCG